MAKFNISTAQGGGNNQTLSETAVEELQSDMPTMEGASDGVDPDLMASIDELVGSVDAGVDAINQRQVQDPKPADMTVTPELQAEIDNQQRPSIKQRVQQDLGAYKPKGNKKVDTSDGLGGMFRRANNLIQNVTNEEVGMSSFLGTNTVDGLPVVLRKVGAVQDNVGKAQYNPDFIGMMSVVTENWMAENFESSKRVLVQALKKEGIDPDDFPIEEGSAFPKLKGNAQLGLELDREYQRLMGAQETNDRLSIEEATLLGDAAKELYAANNKDLLNREQASGQQTYFVLTPEGADVMTASAQARKKLFPKQQVRPAKSPGLMHAKGEAKNYSKEMSGQIKPKDSLMLKEAKRNLSSIANVVDKQREKIYYMTALPVLAGVQNELTGVFGDIHNMGPKKMQGFIAKEKASDPDDGYVAQENMQAVQNKVAQETRAIAAERGSLNYFTYYTMAYNGRLSPQQTTFDATTSKPVRFVTRAAEPSTARKGSRIDKNLRQMYAMMLVSKNVSGVSYRGKDQAGDMLLPEARERALQNATPQLLKWGRRLRSLVEQGMTDSQLDAVADAIAQGIPLTDPNFPQFTGLQLDPEADADLIREIQAKGEDGPHFIDGLIDFSKYTAAMEKHGKYDSYFNAYFDGKTNGLAANGIQMGSIEVALATGVIRNQGRHLLDDGDLRDKLQDTLLDTIKDQTGGLMFTSYFDEVGVDKIYEVARKVFSHRDLNKWSTMTFGYGLDISSMGPAIDEAAALLYEMALEYPQLDSNANYIVAYEGVKSVLESPSNDLNNLSDVLLSTYSAGVVSVLSADAIKSRALMKSSAALAAFADIPFTIRGPHGMPLHFGGTVIEANVEPEQRISYRVNEDGKQVKRTTDIYPPAKKTAAAARDERTGGKAMGGAVPGPIQATDAATVASLVTGKSWERMKAASGGKPYVHTIYDAFKVDARGYDVALEEVNKNWYNINMKWSYLEQAYNSNAKSMDIIAKAMKALDPKKEYLVSDFPMLDYLLKQELNEYGSLVPRNLKQFIKQTGNLPADADPDTLNDLAKNKAKHMIDGLRKVGIPVHAIDRDTALTGKQIVDATRYILKDMNVQSRLSVMIKQTEAKKKELDKELKRLGVPVYQYYAH